MIYFLFACRAGLGPDVRVPAGHSPEVQSTKVGPDPAEVSRDPGS